MNKKWQNPCKPFTTQFEQEVKNEMVAEGQKIGLSIGQLIQKLWEEKRMQEKEPNIYQQWLADVENLGDDAHKSWRYQHLISGLTSEFSGNKQAQMMFEEYDSAIKIFRVKY